MTTSTPTRIAAGVTAGYLRDLSRHPATAVAAAVPRPTSGGDGLVAGILERDRRAASRLARRRGSGADEPGAPGRGHRGACSDRRGSSSSVVASHRRAG